MVILANVPDQAVELVWKSGYGEEDICSWTHWKLFKRWPPADGVCLFRRDRSGLPKHDLKAIPVLKIMALPACLVLWKWYDINIGAQKCRLGTFWDSPTWVPGTGEHSMWATASSSCKIVCSQQYAVIFSKFRLSLSSMLTCLYFR